MEVLQSHRFRISHSRSCYLAIFELHNNPVGFSVTEITDSTNDWTSQLIAVAIIMMMLKCITIITKANLRNREITIRKKLSQLLSSHTVHTNALIPSICCDVIAMTTLRGILWSMMIDVWYLICLMIDTNIFWHIIDTQFGWELCTAAVFKVFFCFAC